MMSGAYPSIHVTPSRPRLCSIEERRVCMDCIALVSVEEWMPLLLYCQSGVAWVHPHRSRTSASSRPVAVAE